MQHLVCRLPHPGHEFALQVGNALNLQGMLLVVGHVLGPVAVVIFSTARTVSRVAVQRSDFPALEGFVIYASLLYVIAYLLVDVAYMIIDPRTRT